MEPSLVASWISGGFAPVNLRETGLNPGADYDARNLETRAAWLRRGFVGGWGLAQGTLIALLGLPAGMSAAGAIAFTSVFGAGFGGIFGTVIGLGLHSAIDPAAAETLRQERRVNVIASETLFEQMRCSHLFTECSPTLLVLSGNECPTDA